MAEARDLDRARRPLEQLPRTEAVAHRPGADANRVGRYLEEGVERDDLVHLAAADVHVVGDGVRELHRDRPHLAAHAPEVVEEACPLAWELGKQRCEPEHVHPGESIRRPEASGVPSSGRGGASPSSRRSRADLADGSSPRVGAEPRVRRAASRPAARPRARGCAPGCARPARLRAAPGPTRAADAALLRVRERARRLDVEQRLDPRRGLLRVLPARSARARHTQLDLRDGQRTERVTGSAAGRQSRTSLCRLRRAYGS